jgi:tripartite-type tricarboxylate transporter receptor subunit TctC
MIKPSRRRVLATAFASALAAPAVLRADTWPSGPVVFLNPFPAGGGTDTFCRPLAAHVGEQLGQQVIVDNKGGAGGTVGASLAAKAKPDGSLFFVGAVHDTIARSVYKHLDYDLEKSSEPITMIALVPQVISVNPQRLPMKTAAEFLDYARMNPGKVNFASSGTGTAHHLAGELFKIETKTDLMHVPYRGAGPAMQDLLAGNVDMMFDAMGTSATQIRSGKLRGLGVATPQRMAEFSDIPTSAEIGVPRWIVSTWYGVWAIKGTPQPIVERMYLAIAKALQNEKILAIWKDKAAEPGGEKPQQFAARIRSEIEKWEKVVGAAEVRID